MQILKEKELKFNEINMTPRASVIVPVRGIDECMEENVKSLLQQDYPDYQVVYVVDPDSEPNLVEKLKK
ncbi:glycosyltransferase [Sulfuracidifex metallicus]|nr:glycosyltransferase family 2 protein [Sulfuracidifex metallicus]